jgi:flagellar biosynthesis protein FliQ
MHVVQKGAGRTSRVNYIYPLRLKLMRGIEPMDLKSFVLGLVVGAAAATASILFGRINIAIEGSNVFSTATKIAVGASLVVLFIALITVLGITTFRLTVEFIKRMSREFNT